MTKSLYKNNTNDGYAVHWMRLDYEPVDIDTINSKVAYLESLGYEPTDDQRMMNNCTSFGYIFSHQSYCLIKRKNGTVILRWWSFENDRPYQLCRYCDDQERVMSGSDAWLTLLNNYKSRTDKGLLASFGDLKKLSREERENLHKCIPSPQCYANPLYVDKKLYGCSKADISSFYPSILINMPIPTTKGFKIEEGCVLPNKEYFLALYPEQKRIVAFINNEYIDSAIEEDNEYYPVDTKNKTCTSIPITKTYLFKKADDIHEKALKDCYEHFYQVKNTAPKNSDNYASAKAVMNFSIGCMYDIIPPIPALVKLLALRRINQLISTIKDDIIGIFTDSMIVGGSLDGIAVKEKSLGAFVYEFKDRPCIIHSGKVYQYIDNDGQLITRWSGVKKDLRDMLKYGDVAKPVDLLKEEYHYGQEEDL